MPAGDARFVTLADILRAPSPVAGPVADKPPATAVVLAPALLRECNDSRAAIGAAKLFCAAVADVVESVAAQMLRELAGCVLLRELAAAPVDMTELARRLIHERCADGPLRLRVAPADAHVECELPLVVDPALAAGDAILECRDGNIDARLGVRLADVLAELRC